MLPIRTDSDGSIGDIVIYKQPNALYRFEQSGLFVSGFKSEWIALVPLLFREILGAGVIIELPNRTKLTSARDGISSPEHDLAIRKGLIIAYAYACLYLYVQKNNDISSIPRDFYDTAKHYQAIESEIEADANAINQQLEKQKYQWHQLDFKTAYYSDPEKDHGRDRSTKLLTRIKYSDGPNWVNLHEIVQKGIQDANAAFLKKIQEAKHKQAEEQEEENALMKILEDKDLDTDQRVLRDVICWIYWVSGVGFYDVVFYHKKEHVLATPGSAKIGKDGQLQWKVRLNVVHCSSFCKVLQDNNPWALIYTPQPKHMWSIGGHGSIEEPVLEVIAHEYAHVMEYQRNLDDCLDLLAAIKIPLTIPSTTLQQCRELIKKHFVSQFKTDAGKLCPGDVVVLSQLIKLFDTIPGEEANKAQVLKRINQGYNLKYNLSHNADERMEESFINYMRLTIERFLRCKRFKELPQFVTMSLLLHQHKVSPAMATVALDAATRIMSRTISEIETLIFSAEVFHRFGNIEAQMQYLINTNILESAPANLKNITSINSRFIQYLLGYCEITEIEKIVSVFKKDAPVHELDVLVDFSSSALRNGLMKEINNSDGLQKKLLRLLGKATTKNLKSKLFHKVDSKDTEANPVNPPHQACLRWFTHHPPKKPNHPHSVTLESITKIV